MLHEARHWQPAADGRVLCSLCPRACRIGEGQAGFCFIRQNHGGRLLTAGYGRSTGFAVDPIEKKPLAHYLPGSSVLSFGTAGCCLGCRFCQNWDISKARLDASAAEDAWTPERVVDLAVARGALGIAFTYNDPIIWAEYAIDVAREAHARGLFTVFVTSGYVAGEARAEIFRHMDATNVDLKAFTEDFYARITLSHLAPVLDTLAWLARETDVWVEVTNLLIPGLNDAPDETRRLADWVAEHMGPDVPVHFTAFHPDYKLLDRPRTPPATLTRARSIARAAGLRHVYTGNVHDPEGQTTYCPRCGARVIERDWHAVRAVRMKGGACAECGERIAGRFAEGEVAPTAGRRVMLGLPEL
ncbi:MULTISPECIES: AmmeMemoRadiSam system radical SAM enzyme [unclassified Anaeromyxobacter]|uniref:AmmeMemoRadiSam system radical SAM enzyme n=1 Tax=unclassified Anaeromyxobacter TaxID=2620896 RepID=UPI001F55F6D8|nr:MULTISPECIES: AmmeMemoRadiSam system radical SAM enzyme [unclassified Anaeromyxobacter]